MTVSTETSVLDAVEARLTPDTIRKMSAQLGTDLGATQNAISMAVPLLLGRLAKNVAKPEGSKALDEALTAHDGSILDNLDANNGVGGLGGLLGSGGIGAAILKHILGSRRGPVEEGVGRATGMNAQQVGQLLMMLAPLVMGVLGRMKRQRNVGSAELPEILGQANAEVARQSPVIGELSRILDRDNDGEIADDVARLGASIFGGMFAQNAR